MAFDPQLLQRAVDTAADRVRDEMARQTQAIVEDLHASADAERDRAVAEAREAAMREANERTVALVAAAEAEARNVGHTEGKAAGRQQGLEAGLDAGRAQGIAEG